MSNILYDYRDDFMVYGDTVNNTPPRVLSVNGTLNDFWYILACQAIQGAATGSFPPAGHILDNLAGAYTLSDAILPANATNWYSSFLADVYQLGAGANNLNSQSYVQAFTAGNSVRGAYNSIFCLPKGSQDHDQVVSGNATGTSYAAIGSSLTFTPGSTGDYLIIASAQPYRAKTTDDCGVELYDGTTEFGATVMRMNATTSPLGWPWFTMVKQTLTGGTSYTFSIRGKRASSPDMGFGGNPYIIALRLDRFPAYYYSEQYSGRGTPITTTETTYSGNYNPDPGTQPSVAVQQTPGGGYAAGFPHLLLSCARLGCSSTSIVASCRTTNPSKTIMETVHTFAAATNQQMHCGMNLFIGNGAGTSQIEWHRNAAGGFPTPTASIDEAAICVIQLTDTIPVRILGGNVLGGKFANG